MFDLGDQVRLSVTFTVTDGATKIAPSSVILKIKDPDEIVTQYTFPSGINSDELGIYYRDFQLTKVGRYYYRWEGNGGNPSATESYLTVKPSEFA